MKNKILTMIAFGAVVIATIWWLNYELSVYCTSYNADTERCERVAPRP